MSTSLKSLMAIYEVRPKKGLKKPAKARKKPTALIQPSSSVNTLGPIRNRLGRRAKALERPKNHSIEPKVRSGESSFVQGHTSLLNRSLDEDLEKLENLTVRNISIRQDWLQVQQKVLDMGLSKQLNTIKESDEYTHDYYPENIFANPVDLLVQKYETHQRNNSLGIFPS